MKRNYFALETQDDLQRALKAGAGVAAFVMAVTLLMVVLGIFSPGACVDALLFATGAWFVLTKQSRVAAGGLVLLYAFEIVGGMVDPNPAQARPNIVTLICLITLVQAFRASLKWHRLVTVPKAILASESAEPPVPLSFHQGVV